MPPPTGNRGPIPQPWVAPEAVPSGDSIRKYARDLTQAAREGKIDDVIGRDEVIRRTMQGRL